MALTSRKPRPITRGVGVLRDTKLFIVACDDKVAPVQYFSFFKITRVQVHVVPTPDGSSAAEHVLARLMEFKCEEDDERWLVLDTDHTIRGSHLTKLRQSIRTAETNDIGIAMSNPCFELWLLLHHESILQSGDLHNADLVLKRIRHVRGNYSKTALISDHYALQNVVAACERARKLDSAHGHGAIPDHVGSRVYKIWDAIFASSLSAQLPPEFAEENRSKIRESVESE